MLITWFTYEENMVISSHHVWLFSVTNIYLCLTGGGSYPESRQSCRKTCVMFQNCHVAWLEERCDMRSDAVWWRKYESNENLRLVIEFCTHSCIYLHRYVYCMCTYMHKCTYSHTHTHAHPHTFNRNRKTNKQQHIQVGYVYINSRTHTHKQLNTQKHISPLPPPPFPLLPHNQGIVGPCGRPCGGRRVPAPACLPWQTFGADVRK